MSKQLKLRRGTTAQHSTFTGASGEVTVDTTKKALVVHDGATAGGVPMATEASVTTGLAGKQPLNSNLTAIAAVGQAMFKNRIINGAMMIDQRSAGASTTVASNGYFSCDRWKTYSSPTSKYAIQQNAGAVTPPAGFSKYLGITSASAYSVGSGDYFWLEQSIEGNNIQDLAWGTASASSVTLSFWVRSSLTGQFGGSLTNAGRVRAYPFSYTINAANTWEQKTITVAGDTSGTWATDNTAGLLVIFDLGSGSTYLRTAGSWGGDALGSTGDTKLVATNGATFYITGVQLEKGTSSTSFDYRPYGTELALCQRYLPCFNANISFGGVAPICSVFASAANSALATIPFMVQPRVPPTGATVSNSSDFTVNLAGTGGTGTVAFAYGSLVAGSVSITQSGRTAGQAGYFYATVSTAQIQFTGCEL